MSELGALPAEIPPLDRAVPITDDRGRRTPRRERGFPDPHRDSHAPGDPEAPASPATEDDPDAEHEPATPRIDVHVLGHILPTRQIHAPAPHARSAR